MMNAKAPKMQNKDELYMSAEYADYIMQRRGGERLICNGDALIEAMADEYLFEEFCESVG